MKKTFRQLQAGDVYYVVNTGTLCGGVRLEEYKILEPFKKLNKEGLSTMYIMKVEDYFDMYLDEIQLDYTSCGFLFTDLDEAKEYYIKKAGDVVEELSKEIEEIEKVLKTKYRTLWNNRAHILQNLEELNYAKEKPEEYAKILEKTDDYFKPVKMYKN